MRLERRAPAEPHRRLRPPVPYYGGKQTLAPRIVEHFPAHGHYVEPYAGSLAVLLAKPVSKMETVNDLDCDLVNFWRVLRERPGDLEDVCAMTPHARTEHTAALAETEGADDLERARRVWVQLTQGRGGTRRRTGWRNYENPGGSSTAMPGYLRGYVARMGPAAQRLLSVSLECRPGLDVIRAYGEHEGVLLYVDPPYLGSVRTSRQYAVEMSGADEHAEMLEALRACRAAVVLSGYPNELYDGELRDWHRVALQGFTGQSGRAGARVEVLWMNRDPNTR